MANWKHEITHFITHDILTIDENPHGYILLWPLWSYLILDTYASLEVHTTETLEKGEEALRHYAAIMQVLEQHFTTVYLLTSMRQEYISTTEYDSEKSWNFPKNHTHAHMFSDILAKGVTRGYNTKVNEGMHGPLKD